MMTKKLVGVSLAALLAVRLWSPIPAATQRILGKIHRLEVRYKKMVAWSLDADK